MVPCKTKPEIKSALQLFQLFDAVS